MVDSALKAKVLLAQKNEITERLIYSKLSSLAKDKQQAQILDKISGEELKHYEFFKTLTNLDVKPNRLKISFFVFIAKVFGLTFGLKLLEKGEDLAQDDYEQLQSISSEVEQIIQDEKTHENQLIDLIDEDRLKYVSSIVLGLNDAMVELTGALVGFSLALQNTRLVGIVGLITGIAASLSMAASEYLSTRHEKTDKSPLKASIYTGLTYIGTVVILILPYLLLENIYLCLSLVIVFVLLIISVFTYYISVAKELDFRKRFLEMAGISVGVAAINFVIGLVIRHTFGIEV
ncbi:MAG: VIT1/CCC1 transporter family protein [Candidatus Omnitrophica bacterium]|nr:VIT1/CCC1 transporter family protein [Candidatus Omnitrophota bacterium]MBU1090866.1 VIT1/CCC1 transporter family protein [Candidatus Omnitrophota bacterium]